MFHCNQPENGSLTESIVSYIATGSRHYQQSQYFLEDNAVWKTCIL